MRHLGYFGRGSQARGRPSLLLPERFTLMFSDGTHRRCQVRWRGEKFIGVKFVEG